MDSVVVDMRAYMCIGTLLFFVNRSNDENADAYKIFSILYGLGKYI